MTAVFRAQHEPDLGPAQSGVAQFAWAPDSKQIAFTVTDPGTEALQRRRDKYGDVEWVGHDYQMQHLWVIDVRDGSLRRLTRGSAFTVGSFSWSPDGQQLAFDATIAPTSV